MSRIFLPSAAIGNSYSLVTLGGSGEMQAFFYHPMAILEVSMSTLQ